VYASAWAATYDHPEGALPEESNVMWKAQEVQPAALRTALRFRFGSFYNAKLARRYGQPYMRLQKGVPGRGVSDGNCPLCGNPDSNGHILGGCRHSQMQAMYVARHDKAVRSIHKTLLRNAGGAAYTVMDACREEELQEYSADAKRLPEWLLPGVPEEERRRMRPDILRVIGLPAAPTPEQVQEAVRCKHRHPIQIVEVGYTADTKWQEKRDAKKEQHKMLVTALRQAGWTVETYIILVGRTGTVYKFCKAALEQLGTTRQAACALLVKLSVQAVLAAHNIGMARRRLERGQGRAGVG
jgi:hypothetical protein